MIQKTLITVIAIVLLAASAASAGPVLHEVLNCLFLDQGTPTHPIYGWFTLENWKVLTKEEPIGQTFITGPDTAKIVRIRCKLEPDADWQKGEGVELVVWDSPAKKTALGRYTVGYEFRGYQFAQPEWEVKAEVKPNTEYYFELSYVGEGDGKLSKVGLMNGTDSYKEGQGYSAGKEADFDVCFQTHATRPMDTNVNLKKAFARFNLDMPELADVKAFVDKEDFDAAQAELVAYFEARQKPIPTLGTVASFPGFDIKEADLALSNYFQSTEMGKGYAGPDINWRGQPEFSEDGHIAASGWCTGLNRFGPRGPLTKGYLATGDDKYVKKLNDVLIDRYLDNPIPSISKIGGDDSDPVWATLNAGIRLAADFICYSRIYKSPAFTLDGRMAYILNLADEADWLVAKGADDGGNWAFTSNGAMFRFALNFPEYKNAPLWRDTALERLALVSKRDVLPDGVENEAAPGYQRMSYGPLVSVYKLMQERGVESPLSAEWKSIIEGQAEYFMYLTMPNGVTPFYGDWGNTQERDSLKADSVLLDRLDLMYAATAGKQGTKPRELSKIYPYYGILTMRSDWGDTGDPYEDARYLFMHGYRRGSHGHSDLNMITCYAYGRELLADPGSYTYGSPEHNYLMTSQAHNVMTINGENGERWPKTRWNYWATTPVADYVSSWADSYKSGSQNREVFYIRANGSSAKDYWVVRDTADGEGKHSVEQRWHLYPGPSQFDKQTLTAGTAFPTGGNLSITPVNPSQVTCEETTTKTWMPRGANETAKDMPTFVYEKDTALPVAIDTVLFPYKGKRQPPMQVKSVAASDNGLESVFKVVQGNVEDVFAFVPDNGPRSLLPNGDIAYDGQKLFVRKIKGKLSSLFMVNGANLVVDGKQIIKLAARAPWVAVSFEKNEVEVYVGDGDSEITVPAANGRKVTVTDMITNDIIRLANTVVPVSVNPYR